MYREQTASGYSPKGTQIFPLTGGVACNQNTPGIVSCKGGSYDFLPSCRTRNQPKNKKCYGYRRILGCPWKLVTS